MIQFYYGKYFASTKKQMYFLFWCDKIIAYDCTNLNSSLGGYCGYKCENYYNYCFITYCFGWYCEYMDKI